MSGLEREGEIRTVSSADGYALAYRVWRAAGEETRGTLVLLNGVMSHSAWFAPIAGALAAAGLHVVGADRRGSGTNMERRGDAPDRETLVRDVRAILDAERRGPVFLAGWCWGAVLAVNVALEVERDLAGLVMLAPGLYPTAALKARMAQELERHAGAPEDAVVLESPIPEALFTEGPALEGFILRDHLRLRAFTPRFFAINAKMTMNAVLRLRSLTAPMLLVLAERDEATDNADTLRGFAKLRQGQVEVERIDGRHGLQFDAPDALARAVVRFVDGRLRALS